MIHATNNYSCPNVHASSMSIPYIHYEVAMQLTLDIIHLNCSSLFQVFYDITSCDMSCDCSHMPLHYQ